MSQDGIHDKVNIGEIIGRFRQAMNFATDKEAAKALGLSPSDFFNKKKRGTLLTPIIEFTIDKSVNLDWLLTGRGDPHGESVSASEAEDPELSTLMALARKVLTSGNQQAVDALGKNILYFAHAIEVERRLSKLEEEMEAIKALIRSKSPPEAESPREEAI